MVNRVISLTTAQTDEAILIQSAVTVSSTVSTTILSAEVLAEGQRSDRILIIIGVKGKDVFIKPQAASVDNVKKGIPIPKNGSLILEVDGLFTGEISAIAVSRSASVYVTVM